MLLQMVAFHSFYGSISFFLWVIFHCAYINKQIYILYISHLLYPFSFLCISFLNICFYCYKLSSHSCFRRVPQASPSGSISKESACNAGAPVLIPEWGRSPEEGNGHPLQYSCLENPMDRGAWKARAHGVTKSRHCLQQPGHGSNLDVLWQMNG